MKLFSFLLSLLILCKGTQPATGEEECPCSLPLRPPVDNKAQTARWMAHVLNWGVLSTVSSRIPGNVPFGNVYSFVDGSCDFFSGTPYFYGTYMDQSFKDMKECPQASFALSEASLSSVCGVIPLTSCLAIPTSSGKRHVAGDPESPLCARLTLTGTLVPLDPESAEYSAIQAAFFLRHPEMEQWPKDHDWIILKLELLDIWLVDFFGGASTISVEDYEAEDLLFEKYS